MTADQERRAARWWTLLVWGLGLVPLGTGLVWPRPFDAPHLADLTGGTRLDLASLVTSGLTGWTALLATAAVVAAPRVLRRDLAGCAVAATAIGLAGSLLLAGAFGSRPALPVGVVAGLLAVTALVLLPAPRPERFFPLLRNLCRVYVFGSLAAMAVAWGWAVEQPYTQGWFSFLPLRLHGLAVHSNSIAVFGFVLLCLALLRRGAGERGWVRPVDLAGAAAVLLLAQSKTFWAITALALGAALLRGLAGAWAARLSPGMRWVALQALVLLFLGVLLACSGPLADLVREQESSISTLTGRTQVWAVTLELWQRSPWFGYGPALWDQTMAEERLGELGWLVYQSHNQLVQTLGQSGLVGAAALILHHAALAAAALAARPGLRTLAVLLVGMLLLRGLAEGWHRAVVTPGGFLFWIMVLGTVLAALPRLDDEEPAR